MTGFDKYRQEMDTFEKSGLYVDFYGKVLQFIYQRINREPVLSPVIEAEFGLKGTQVRNIIHHARRSGHPIASNSYGYYIENDYDKYMDGIEHLRERAFSMLFTYSRAKRLARCSPQLSLKI